MKTTLTTHKEHIGPEISIDLAEVVLIEQHGQRSSTAGWVSVELTLKSGRSAVAQMAPEGYDQLLIDWGAQ